MRLPRPGKRPVRWALLLVVLGVGAYFGYRYWLHSRLYASTDDAYVQAHTVDISAEVAGQVSKVYVKNNDKVASGAPLFDLDARPYRLALAKAQADEAQRRAELANARSILARNLKLVKRGFLSKQAAETARTQETTAQAALEAAQAAVKQAALDLERTHVAAPGAGTIANLTLRPGDAVQPRAPLFTLIESGLWWVDANFKETQLARLHPGEHATITVDMYPDHVFHGVVESLSGGSGTAFSLLPPQNATGNWVKVTQRVPVRVRITDPVPQYPLRIGTTATVEVRTRRAGEEETRQAAE